MELNNTFSVTPMGNAFSLKAGEEKTGTITVVNPATSTVDLHFKAYVAPYGVIGENYEADVTSQTEYSEITKWIKIATPEGKVAPNESAEIEYKIKVPEDAAGGGQYAAIIIQSVNASTEESSGVQSLYEIASIIYADIDGETVHAGEILENQVPGFSTVPHFTTSMQLSNDGNTHEYAKVNLSVVNFLTGEDIYSSEDATVVPYQDIIMPGTKRLLTRDITGIPTLGVVNVNQTVEYMGETSAVQKTVFICPVWFILLLSFAICSIIALIVARIRKHSKTKAQVSENK